MIFLLDIHSYNQANVNQILCLALNKEGFQKTGKYMKNLHQQNNIIQCIWQYITMAFVMSLGTGE